MADRPARNQPPCCRTVCLAICCSLLAVCGLARASELRQSPIVKAVQAARPSIVNIRGEKMLNVAPSQVASADGNRRVNGMGTGVVIDPRGYIITNYHVVDGVREIQVTLEDETKYVGRLLDRDSETDLALLKIDLPRKLPVINIGISSDLMPGAVGSGSFWKGFTDYFSGAADLDTVLKEIDASWP